MKWADLGGHGEAGVVQVDEVGGVALAVMRLASALPPIRLARQFADVGDGGGAAQKGGQIGRKRPHGGHPDQPVPARSPGLHLHGRQGQDDGGDGRGDDAFHERDPVTGTALI